MKKIAIITLVGNNNYGNRLQNYALVKAIRKQGDYEISTIWYNPWNKTIKDFFKKDIFSFMYGLNNYVRRKSFVKFSNSFTYPTKKTYYLNDNLKVLDNLYDSFIIGSDQIWNYEFCNDFGNFEFAMFADTKKCSSYSASFGISSIPDNKKSVYKNGLLHLNKISVREDAGAKIVKELTGREAKVVLDPTMLLTADEWEQVEVKPNTKLPRKYILTYFLGNKTEQQNKEINELSQKYNLEIISLNDKSQQEYYKCGPSEFVYLFHHSELVFTDSFHACVFSILFNKPFFVFDRNEAGITSMNSRLDTLLNKFNLTAQKVNSVANVDDLFKINYNNTIEILNSERKYSYEFLKSALGE